VPVEEEGLQLAEVVQLVVVCEEHGVVVWLEQRSLEV